MRYYKERFDREVLTTITLWAKAVKVGSDDLVFYQQAGKNTQMYGVIRSETEICGFKRVLPLFEGDTKFPFEVYWSDDKITDPPTMNFAADINKLVNFEKAVSAAFPTNLNMLYVQSIDQTLIPARLITSSPDVGSLELLPNVASSLYNTIGQFYSYLLYCPIVESIDVTNDPNFMDIMKLKAADGGRYYQTPQSHILMIWPRLIIVNKGDRVRIEVLKDPQYTNIFFVCYTVEKPSKHYKTEVMLRYIQPR